MKVHRTVAAAFRARTVMDLPYLLCDEVVWHILGKAGNDVVLLAFVIAAHYSAR